MTRSARSNRLTGLAGRGLQATYIVLLMVLSTSISWAQELARDGTQPEARSFVQLTGGTRFMCGLIPEGEAFCWGQDDHGQVGAGDVVYICPRYYLEGRFGRYGTQGCALTPHRVAGGLSFTMIDAGASHTCGLTAAGEAFCWGSNFGGALGTTEFIQCGPVNDSVLPPADRTTNCSRDPVRVSSDRRFASMSVGGASACALTPEGEAYCWGRMRGPQDPPPPLNTSVPRAVPGNIRFTSLTVGRSRACGLDRAGEVYCWGQLPDEPAPVPVPVALTTVSQGADHTCGLTAAGVAYCWGDNSDGQVGTGRAPEAHERVDTATEVAGGLRFREIQAGHRRTCGITTDRTLYCWGDRAGSFGPDRCFHVDAYSPCTVGPRRVLAEPVRTVGLGQDHNCAVTVDGSGYCWGSRWAGGFGDRGPTQGIEYDPVRVNWSIPPPIVPALYVIRCTADRVTVIPHDGADTPYTGRDTTISYASTTPGFVTPERVTIRGAEYISFGVLRHVHSVDLHWFAEHEGVPFFRRADDDAGAPEVLYLPHAPTCVMQPYVAR